MLLSSTHPSRLPSLFLALGLGVLGAPLTGALAEDWPQPHGSTVVLPKRNWKPSKNGVKDFFPPVQLELRTPLEPTLVASGGRGYLVYELRLQNASDQALDLSGLEILSGDDSGGLVIAELNAQDLKARLRSLGGEPLLDRRLGAGRAAVVYLMLAFPEGCEVPQKLGHRMLLGSTAAHGPAVATNPRKVKVLGPPVAGPDWVPAGNPSLTSHHRMGLWVGGGLAQISRRYAIDWKVLQKGASFSGDPLDVRAYHCYGKPVFAVADGWVVHVQDGLPDNIPRTPAGFKTAVPITMANLAGNAIVLDLGDGQFAYYAHLQSGSLRVKVGDRVKRGKPLARIGNSGDAREPHLHFQVGTTPELMASEGLPYLLDHFRAKRTTDVPWEPRSMEFPMGDLVVDFGPEVDPEGRVSADKP